MTHDCGPSAQALWQARRQGGTVAPPGQGWDEPGAYALQDALIAAASETPCGWKVGATGEGAPGVLGLSGPLAAPLWARFASESGARVPLFAAHRPQVEGELAFRMARTPRSDAPDDVAAAVDAVALALEFIGSRLSHPTAPAGPGVIADHGANGHVVLGEWRRMPEPDTLASIDARLTIDGRAAADGRGANVLGSPLNSLCWLIGHLAARDVALEPGAVVISGAMVPPTDFPIGATLTFKAEGLAPVTADTLEQVP